PQRRPGATAAQSNVLNWDIELGKNRESIFQTESHAFENRANDVGSRMGGGQPEQRAARIRIEMRSALAHQIWGPQEPIRAGRRGCRFLRQSFIRLATVLRAR